MTNLPEPVATFVAGVNAHDNEAAFAGFEPEATLVDDNLDLRGLDAIRAFSAERIVGANCTFDVVDAVTTPTRTDLVTHVTGDFEGGPLALHLGFDHPGATIAAVHIGGVPADVRGAVLPAVVAAYFARATAADPEPWFALFADDAHVEDDGRTYDGIAAIRAWRASGPEVPFTPTEVRAEGDGLVVLASVAGAVPGSPVRLRFRFVALDATHVRDLRIER